MANFLFVSMKHQHRAQLPTAQYASLLEFESLHPELYAHGYAPRQAAGPIGGIYTQGAAFDRVASHPVHGVELQSLVQSHPTQIQQLPAMPQPQNMSERSQFLRKILVAYNPDC
jgi:hypothetical protein